MRSNEIPVSNFFILQSLITCVSSSSSTDDTHIVEQRLNFEVEGLLLFATTLLCPLSRCQTSAFSKEHRKCLGSELRSHGLQPSCSLIIIVHHSDKRFTNTPYLHVPSSTSMPLCTHPSQADTSGHSCCLVHPSLDMDAWRRDVDWGVLTHGLTRLSHHVQSI